MGGMMDMEDFKDLPPVPEARAVAGDPAILEESFPPEVDDALWGKGTNVPKGQLTIGGLPASPVTPRELPVPQVMVLDADESTSRVVETLRGPRRVVTLLRVGAGAARLAEACKKAGFIEMIKPEVEGGSCGCKGGPLTPSYKINA